MLSFRLDCSVFQFNVMGVSLDDGRQIGKILSFSRLLILSAFVSTSHWVQLFADNSAL